MSTPTPTICSLLPSATEIVFALGLGDRLAAVTHECDFPPEAARLPVITRSQDVMTDLYRDDQPDPQDIGRFEWQTIRRRKETAMEQGLGSNTWWEEREYKQLGTSNLRALFILDKLLKRDTPRFQAAWAVAFSGRLIYETSHIQPDEVTRGPWLVILTRMGATREETTDILDRVGRRW